MRRQDHNTHDEEETVPFFLEALEDMLDIAAVKEAEEEIEREGTIPWEQIKEELDL